jgi:peroxiredoxin Q/BCP
VRRLFAIGLIVAAAACKSSSPNTASTPSSSSGAAATPIARGDKAPPFSLQGSDGNTHSLADHAGKEVVVIAWFPQAFTGG